MSQRFKGENVAAIHSLLSTNTTRTSGVTAAFILHSEFVNEHQTTTSIELLINTCKLVFIITILAPHTKTLIKHTGTHSK